MQDRLLNAYLVGTVDEDAYKSKSNDLKGQGSQVEESLQQFGRVALDCHEVALALFEGSQRAAEIWRRSCNTWRREILD